MVSSQGLTFAFNRGVPKYDTAVAVVQSVIYHGHIVLGLYNGDIRIYELENADTEMSVSSANLVAHVDSAQTSPLSYIKAATDTKSNQDYLFAAYADGVIVKFELNTGIACATTKLAFRCYGLNCDFTLNQGRVPAILVWGQSNQVLVLEWGTLKLLIQVNALLPNWPITVPLVSDQILLVSRSGQALQYRLNLDQKPSKSAYLIKKIELDELLAEPAEGTGHFHDVDLIISVQKIGHSSWMVVQRHGWTIFKRQDSSLTREIGTSISKPLVNAFVLDEGTFGLVAGDGTLYLVVNHQMVPVEKNWDGSVVDIHFYKSKLWATVENEGGISLYTADFDTDRVGQIAWSSQPMILEDSIAPIIFITRIVSINKELYICEAKGQEVHIYASLSGWRAGTSIGEFSLNDATEDFFTAVEVNCIRNGILITGTNQGKIIILKFDGGSLSLPQTITPFASPVLKFLGPKEKHDDEELNILIAVSVNSTVAVIDTTNGHHLFTIPGNCTPVAAITISRQKSTALTVTVKYDGGDRRSWNLVSHIETSIPQEDSADVIECIEQSQSDDKLVSVPVGTPRTFSSFIVKLDKLKDVKIQADLADALLNGDLGFVSTETSAVRQTISYLNFSKISRFSVCSLVTCEILCGWILGKKSQDIQEIRQYLSNLTLDVIVGVLTTRTKTGSGLFNAARLLLDELLRKLNVDNRDSLQSEIEDSWFSHLPCETRGDIFQESCLESLLVVSSYCRTMASAGDKSDKVLLDRYSRSVAESLMMYLTSDSLEICRETAIEIIGRGWDLWQKFFNPLSIVDSLLVVLYNHELCKLDKTSFLSSAKWSHPIAVCLQCVQNVAVHNSTLLISALVTRVVDEARDLSTRITALRLLTLLISLPITQELIGPSHLATFISPVVRCLDHGEASIRDTPELASNSLVVEATQFLSMALSRYPEYMAFNKAQQRLAIAIVPDGTATLYQGLLGLVYDLRTGTLVSSLGINYVSNDEKVIGNSQKTVIPGVLAGSVCHQMEFSPDGKYLAAILENVADWTGDRNQKTIPIEIKVIIAVWKISYGIMSMFQNLSVRQHFSASNYDSSYTESGSNTVLTPSVIIKLYLHATGYFKFKWTSDRDISISGDQDSNPIEFSI